MTFAIPTADFIFYVVPKAGLEPAQLTPQPPQGCVSTNSTTWALKLIATATLPVPLEHHWLPLAQHSLLQEHLNPEPGFQPERG